MTKKSKKPKNSKKAVEVTRNQRVANLRAEARENGKTVEAVVQSKTANRDYPYAVGHTREDTIEYKAVRIQTLAVHTGFALEQVSWVDWKGEVSYVRIMVRVIHSARKLVDFIRNTSGDRVYHRTPIFVPLSDVVDEIDAFEAAFGEMDTNERYPEIEEFVSTLAEQVREHRETYQRMVSRGKLSYDLLEQHFRPGMAVCFGGGESELEGGSIAETEYQMSWAGPMFSIKVHRYGSDGKHFGKTTQDLVIPGYRGDAVIADFAVQIATDDQLAILTERGRMWQTRVHQPQYLTYSGKMRIKIGWTNIWQTANGRCMIDQAMHDQMVTSYHNSNEVDVDVNMTAIPEEYLFTTPGYVMGFSMTKKRWGRFRISGLSPIAFRDDAYDLLVLDPEVKAEVRALVEQSDDMFTDIISGKGGGAIFLLHGTPGLGKTLTAESVAEILHRPLYSVSVGELGVTPGEVEETLQQILEMVTAWNAVLLLDEADIFLEARSKEDIIRNAMVGVFLRLLEYHNGVLFLTTNRVANFDTAVLSRISVILRYPDFTDDIRVSVWNNILLAAGLDQVPIDLPYMAKTYPVNGRQIKNAIRIALSLAAAQKTPVTQELIEGRLERMLSVTKELTDPGEVVAAEVPRSRAGTRA